LSAKPTDQEPDTAQENASKSKQILWYYSICKHNSKAKHYFLQATCLVFPTHNMQQENLASKHISEHQTTATSSSTRLETELEARLDTLCEPGRGILL
jgi:hypothetical protein